MLLVLLLSLFTSALCGFAAGLSTSSSSFSASVQIDATRQHQTLLGVGAAITASTCSVLMTNMSSTERHQFLSTLFSPINSAFCRSYHQQANDDRLPWCGSFSSIRLPMGSSDFAIAPARYSYDDVPVGDTDFNLTHFSIDKDRAQIIPVLKEILAINPQVTIIAAPWSAPGWMKDDPSLGLNGGSLLFNTSVYAAYAQYFRRFVQAYEAESIPIYAVSLQNEPRNQNLGYPTMIVTAEQEQALSLLVAQEFLAHNISTRVVVYDHNWDDADYPIDVFSDPQVNASSVITGAAFHCYAGNVENETTFRDAFPNKEIFFTECCGGAWSPHFLSSMLWDVQNLIIGNLQNWAVMVLKWNLLLDSECGPKLPGGCDTCRGVFTWVGHNFSEGTIPCGGRGGGPSLQGLSTNEDYYALAHLGMFLRPRESIRVSATPVTAVTAFFNPRILNGSDVLSELVVVMINTNDTANAPVSFSALLPVMARQRSSKDSSDDGSSVVDVPLVEQQHTIQCAGTGITVPAASVATCRLQYSAHRMTTHVGIPCWFSSNSTFMKLSEPIVQINCTVVK